MPDPSQDAPDADGADADGDARPNALEWAVFALGVAIALGVIGTLAVQWIAGSDRPADLVVELGAPAERRGQVRIPVEVFNAGDRVAEGAVVEVCAGDACSEITFRYVPKGSTRTGEVGFAAPLGGPAETRVVSYRTL